jgi:hypothetical protein
MKSMDEELKHSVEYVFLLLSLMFDSNSIAQIRKTLEGSEGESSGYALELLDLLVAEDIKQMLFPLIDDISANEKIKLLQDYFPIEKKNYLETLTDILNRDFNLLCVWTKACALIELNDNEKVAISDDIAALIFHPDPMICELADKSVLESLEKRLNGNNQLIVKHLFDKQPDVLDRNVLKVMEILKNNSYFSQITGRKLYQLAQELQIIDWPESYEFPIKEEDSLWLFLNKGRLQIDDLNGNKSFIEQGICSLISGNQHKIIVASEGSNILKMNGNTYQILLFDEPELTNNLILLTQEAE